ncbi:MAG TPA: hypothetical protein VL442_13765 [Mucilaginibacter sp.]|nr:hypothetical protein [Mucilaginibacter sp.]
MKKLLSILCCAVILLSVSSCTKKYISPVANLNKTVNANITSADWVAYTDGKSYYVPIAVPDLDNASAQYDGVVVSVSYDNGQTYEQLPEVYNGLSFSYTYNGPGTGDAGNVSIYAQSPDGGTAIKPTDPILVKIVLVYSE